MSSIRNQTKDVQCSQFFYVQFDRNLLAAHFPLPTPAHFFSKTAKNVSLSLKFIIVTKWVCSPLLFFLFIYEQILLESKSYLFILYGLYDLLYYSVIITILIE